MTTYLNDYKNYKYQTSYSDFYNSVVRVSNTESYGTGALLYDGRSILTAAHIFEGFGIDNITVYFDTSWGTKAYNATIKVYDDYDAINSNGDLAILTLEENVSSFYERYDIYRDNQELGNSFTMAGYGTYGSGQTGELDNINDLLKLKTSNTFDSDFYSIYTSTNTNLLWEPLQDSILAADFDNGYTKNDALGNILDINNLGVGILEGMIASGDSGGPAFINNLIAGVASYTTSIISYSNKTDINNTLDSSFGEIGAWQRVSYYSQWIDKTIREGYENAPSSKLEVQTSILEDDNDSISSTYFLLEFIGKRENILDNITLNYTTRDGTATSGEDYIASSGIITLYYDESSVVIPVEIIGDDYIEENETFYLDITNPSYGSFGDDAVLTAMRTIIDDDFLI